MFSRHETAILKGFHRTDIPSLVLGVEMGTYGGRPRRKGFKIVEF